MGVRVVGFRYSVRVVGAPRGLGFRVLGGLKLGAAAPSLTVPDKATIQGLMNLFYQHYSTVTEWGSIQGIRRMMMKCAELQYK